MILLCAVFSSISYSQSTSFASRHSISLSTFLPLGNFSNTHFIGAGLAYSGGERKTGFLHIKHLGWNYEAGMNYYFGRKENVSGYDYRYRNYSFLYATIGLIYKIKKVTAGIYLGPGLGVYYGNKEFNYTFHTALSYRCNRKYELSLGLFSMEEKKAERLWSTFLTLKRYLK